MSPHALDSHLNPTVRSSRRCEQSAREHKLGTFPPWSRLWELHVPTYVVVTPATSNRTVSRRHDIDDGRALPRRS